jgi:hypothetical protein
VVRQVIDLTGGGNNGNGSESDDDLPSLRRILASASAPLKRNQILLSLTQAANLTYNSGDESEGDDGNLSEVS